MLKRNFLCIFLLLITFVFSACDHPKQKEVKDFDNLVYTDIIMTSKDLKSAFKNEKAQIIKLGAGEYDVEGVVVTGDKTIVGTGAQSTIINLLGENNFEFKCNLKLNSVKIVSEELKISCESKSVVLFDTIFELKAESEKKVSVNFDQFNTNCIVANSYFIGCVNISTDMIMPAFRNNQISECESYGIKIISNNEIDLATFAKNQKEINSKDNKTVIKCIQESTNGVIINSFS